MAQIPNSVTDQQLDEIAGRMQGRNYSLSTSLGLLEFEDDATRERFKERFPTANQAKTFGEAAQRGFGDRFEIAGYEVPVIPKGFVQNAGEMAQALGELLFVDAPQYIGDKVGAAPMMAAPGKLGVKAREEFAGVESRLTKQLIKELTSPESERIQAIRSDIAMVGRDLGERDRLQTMLEEAIREENPLTTALWDTTQKEIFYFTNRQALIDKIAEAPAEVVSDIVSVVAPMLKAPALAAQYPRLSRALNIGVRALDVTEYPGAATRGLNRGVRGAMSGPDVGMTDVTRADGFNPGAAAEEFGAGKELTPDFVRNPHQQFQTREMMRAEQEGGVGQRAWERKEATEAAVISTRERMIQELNQGNEPLNPDAVGDALMDAYDNRQGQDSREIRAAFSEFRKQSASDPDNPDFPTFEEIRAPQGAYSKGGHHYQSNKLRDVIDKIFADMQKSQIPDVDREKAKAVLNELIADVDMENLTLADLDDLRIQFRKRMRLEFKDGKVSEIGSGSIESKIYGELSDYFYEEIDNAVDASGGSLPANLRQRVQDAKQMYKDILELEGSEAGKLLIKNSKNPDAIIKKLASNNPLRVDDLEDLGKLVGEEGMRDVRAGVLAEIFHQMNNGATGLQKKLDDMSHKDPDYLVQLFGGGVQGQEIVDDLNQFAQFSALLEPIPRLFKNSPTGKINMALAGGAAGSAFEALRSIFQIVYYGSDDVAQAAVMSAAAGTLTWMSKNGMNFWHNSEIGRKRLLEGLKLPPQVESVMNDLMEVTARKYVKPTEVGARLTDDGEEK